MLSTYPGNVGIGPARYPEGSAGDPLEGIAFEYGRFQFRRGNNTPLGLYQDTACTIPCENEFDPIAGIKDELGGSGVVATQSNPDKQPVLIFINSVPCAEFDGIDDCLQHGEGNNAPASIFAVARSSTLSAGYRTIAAYGDPMGPNLYGNLASTTNWGAWFGTNVTASNDLDVFKVIGTVVRAPNDVDMLTNAATLTRTNGVAYDTVGDFIGSEAGGTAAFFSGHLAALFAGPHTDYDYTVIRTALEAEFSAILGT